MSLEFRLLTSLGLALLLVHLATPVAIRVANRFEFYDHPVGYKGHGRPTPYLGGAAVVSGFLLTLLLLTGDWERSLPLAAGVGLLWIVGTVDDRRHVSPTTRVTAEAAIALGLWHLGLGWELGAGPVVDALVTVIWIIGVVNAFNLFDNMDGAASSMGGVVAAALAVVGIAVGDPWLAVAGAALSGACLGFLPHNLFASPARIFLGDGGSMPLGFAVAALAMMGVSDAAPAWQSLAMGLLLVGVPALDTTLVVISRTRRGVSVLTGGRDHLTHRTGERLRTARAVAVTLGGAQAIFSALALLALRGGSEAFVAALVLYVVAVGVTVAVLDTRGAQAEALPATTPAASPRQRARPELLTGALLIPLAVAVGLSPLASGYYSSRIWVPVGMVLVVCAAAVAMARPVRLSAPARLTLGGIAALALWALTSALWADSVQQAFTEANRWLLYAVALGLLLLLVRTPRAAERMLLAVTVPAVLLGAFVAVRMLVGDATDLFLRGRLDQPLGYINGQAAFFMLALWPTLAVAARARHPLAAGGGMAAATLLGCLLVLSQSRGVALALVVAVIITLAVVPRRLGLAWAVVAWCVGTACALPFLLDVYSAGSVGELADTTVRAAAVAALSAALGTGLVWGTARRVTADAPGRWRAASVGALGLLLAGALLAGLTNAGTISGTVERQYRAFVSLGSEPSGSGAQSRLVSGGGNRYDYWRVAVDAWQSRPLAGWGAGNYDRPYFANRATGEDIRQPHSLELQVLSELGLIGLLLLSFVGVGMTWAIAVAVRARAAPTAWTIPAAVGMLTAWAAHTSVDWLHLLPGVTAIALIAVVVLLSAETKRGQSLPTDSRRGGRHVSTAIAVAIILTVAGIGLTRQGLSERYEAAAAAALRDDPERALVEADRALRLDPESVRAYHLKAASLARFGQADASRASLLEAARREPGDFVTWALLGDLATRTGDKASERYYARARRLNPREPTLAQAPK